MNNTHISLVRSAALGALLAVSAATASAQVIYEETFGTATWTDPGTTNYNFNELIANFTAPDVAYYNYSTSGLFVKVETRNNWRTNQNAGYTPNIAPDAHFVIAKAGGGLGISGIDTSSVIGQSLTLQLSALIGWAANNGGAGFYPAFTSETDEWGDLVATSRELTANLNDYVKFEASYDGGVSWSELTLYQKDIGTPGTTVDPTRPWTIWEADLGTVVGTELQLRFQDTSLLKETGAYSTSSVYEEYSAPIRIDSLTITAAAVPEPAVYVLGMAASALLFVVLRRRNMRTQA
ncbi:hypothetical protein Ga0100231_021430 [Opitutaceae bacterium TAV4]|nr:hypothetical protein Ga0100231_021430 [Opitutaceae bacterium TAV4]RRJ99767.1 hypothetical protein Ga0100230_017045 [Opitutaceae bacterium TAV3]